MVNKRHPEDYEPEDYVAVRIWTRAEIEAVYTADYLDRLRQACRRVALAHRFGWGLVDPASIEPPPRRPKRRKEST